MVSIEIRVHSTSLLTDEPRLSLPFSHRGVRSERKREKIFFILHITFSGEGKSFWILLEGPEAKDPIHSKAISFILPINLI